MNYNYYTEIPNTNKQLQQTNNINTTNQDNKTNTSNKEDLSYISKIKNFLNIPTGTLLAVAFGVAIGNSFKEFVSSIVVNIIQPILVLIISKTYLNSYYDFTNFISPQKNVLNIELFVSSFITFLLVVITVYLIHETFIARL